MYFLQSSLLMIEFLITELIQFSDELVNMFMRIQTAKSYRLIN